VSRPRIVLDCDPGQDDAIAILCAARYGELVGITTVSGNVDVERTTINALLVTQLAGLDVPVHAGAARPLVGEATHADHVHGTSGLDGPTLPSLEREPASRDAVGYLLDIAADDTWLVPTGPLTNVALALQRDPTLLTRFAGVTLMGGGVNVGNATPTAEFNIWADPEAAATVFSAGAPMTMIGLNLTQQVRMGPSEAQQLRAAGSATAEMVADILDFYSASTASARAAGGAAIHDPCAVLHVTHPDVVSAHRRSVVVETNGYHTRGMTVVDERIAPRTPGEVPADDVNHEVSVGYGVDADRVRDLIVEAAIAPLA